MDGVDWSYTPGSANSLAASYDASVKNRMAKEADQLELDKRKRDSASMLQLQEQLKAAGRDPDLNKIADVFINSGIPDHVRHGIELRQALKAQSDYAALDAPPAAATGGMPPAAATGGMPPAAPVNALGTGTYGTGMMDSAAPSAVPAPANVVAPTNALVTAPTNVLATSAQPNAQFAAMQKRIDDQLRFANSHPGTPQAERAQKTADLLQRELSSIKDRPENADLMLMRRFGIPETPEGFKQFNDLKRQNRLLTPEEFSQEMQLRQSSRPEGSKVYIAPQPKAEGEERGKLLVKQYGGVSDAATLAVKTLPSLESNLKILNDGFDTGWLTGAQTAGANVLAALGVKNADKYATTSQLFSSNATQAVLQKQLEQRGVSTEGDAQRIKEIGAQLGNTKAANTAILMVAKEQLKRDIEQRNFYDKWWKNNKTYDGAEDAWFTGEGGKSLFDRPALKQYQTPTKNTAPDARKPLADIFRKPKG